MKVKWLRGTGETDAHAYRVTKDGAGDRSECGLPRLLLVREDNGPRCQKCRFTISRNRR